jgi:hypothetical protein
MTPGARLAADLILLMCGLHMDLTYLKAALCCLSSRRLIPVPGRSPTIQRQCCSALVARVQAQTWAATESVCARLVDTVTYDCQL